MFVSTREESRDFFLRVWRKMAAGTALEPLETVIARVIADHPEYHAILSEPSRALAEDFGDSELQVNPFLHMGLHIALIEQLQTDRPAGIRAVYQQLVAAGAERHDSEHRMLACLASALQQANLSARAPDEVAYLASLRALLR